LTTPALTITDLVVEHDGIGRVLDGVSLTIAPGESVALVGASGCGKTTLARAVLGLKEVVSGSINIEGTSMLGLRGAGLRQVRMRMQAVFQDPGGSINERMRVGEVVGEPLLVLKGVRGTALKAAVAELLEAVGLDPADASRFPHEFSGGQKQRIAIARALSVAPSLLICDEPTSALDVSVQARILNLLIRLRDDRDMAMLMVTHDLAVALHTCDRIVVLEAGRIVEDRPAADLLDSPEHELTKALVAASI
jgi:ABC-type glutathione transport system ATPase component